MSILIGDLLISKKVKELMRSQRSNFILQNRDFHVLRLLFKQAIGGVYGDDNVIRALVELEWRSWLELVGDESFACAQRGKGC